jgi:WhiB family transcriptional regulator, redox-sensing transcriptional regulator
MTKAACRDREPDLFFPNDSAGVEVACDVCRTCAVREACLEYAIANNIEHGVWGGTSERRRRRITRERRRLRVM